MGHLTAAKKIIALATNPAEIGRLSDDAIRQLVERFHEKIRADSELGPVFERAFLGEEAYRLTTMHEFWTSVMLTRGPYKGKPVAVYLRSEGMEPPLYAHWRALFDETCRELVDDDLAADFRVKVERIAESLKLALFCQPTRPGQRYAP